MSEFSLAAFEREWQRLVRGSLPGWLAAIATEEPPLRDFADPQMLLGFLQRPDADLERKDAVLATLVAAAATDARAARVVLQAILPGLRAQLRRLLLDADERAELWAIVPSCAWEQIRTYRLARRPQRIAANLILDSLKQARAERARETREPRAPAPLTEQLPAPGCFCPGSRADTGGGLIERAVRRGVLSRSEAELVLQTRLDRRSLSELAAEQGLSYTALKLRRQRAEQRLRLVLGDPFEPKRGSKRRLGSARAAGAGNDV